MMAALFAPALTAYALYTMLFTKGQFRMPKSTYVTVSEEEVGSARAAVPASGWKHTPKLVKALLLRLETKLFEAQREIVAAREAGEKIARDANEKVRDLNAKISDVVSGEIGEVRIEERVVEPKNSHQFWSYALPKREFVARVRVSPEIGGIVSERSGRHEVTAAGATWLEAVANLERALGAAYAKSNALHGEKRKPASGTGPVSTGPVPDGDV